MFGIGQKRAKTSITAKDAFQFPGLVNFFVGLQKGAITEWQALQLSAVYACIRLISQSIGMLPLSLHQKTQSDTKIISRLAAENPLNRVLGIMANPMCTAYMFKQTMQTWTLMYGNAYAEIQRNGAGDVVALWPISPLNMRIEIVDNVKKYIYTRPTGEKIMFDQSLILHIPGLSFDGIQGYSPISIMRSELQLATALQDFGTSYFQNGTNLGSVITHPGHLGEKARVHLKEDVEKNFSGLSNAQKMIILEEGMSFDKINIPAEDAQFISARRFSLEEICRYYGVQLHMIQNLDKASFNNIEQQSLEFRTYCLLPWTTIWEQEIYKNVFDPIMQAQNYYVKYNLNALLRADYTTRMNNYRTGVQMGLYSLNDVCELEDMNPIEGEAGDVHWVNAAMINIDQQINAMPSLVAAPKGGDNNAGDQLPKNSNE